MQKYSNFFVSDIFIPTRGKGKYTRDYAEKHPGNYPVYSASLSAPLCYIDSYDYEGTYLTWTTNGYGGRVQLLNGKFSINGDRGIFVPKYVSQPNLNYIKHILEPALINQAVGRIVDGGKNEYTKLSPDIANKTIVSLPVDEDNNLDYDAMSKLSQKILHFESLQNELLVQQDELMRKEVLIDFDGPFKLIFLGDKEYFTLSIGERFLKKNSADYGIPVFSANVRVPFAFCKTSNLDNFDNDSLLWGIDGAFDWNILSKSVEFANTDHCGRLQINSTNLDPEFIFYYLRSTKLEYGFDRVFRANLENVANLISVKIPVMPNGDFDVKKQRKIASRYKCADDLKKKTCKLLDSLCKVKIQLEI